MKKTKKIRDTDYLSATMRVRVMEKSLLSKERMDRMLDARSDEEASKILYECGYGEFSVKSYASIEAALSAERARMYLQMRSIVGEGSLVDVFRIKYDYHNLKVWMKGEARGEGGEALMINSGRSQVKDMLEILRHNETRWLTKAMRAAYEEARDVLARTSDPQISDLILDRACFKEMVDAASASGSDFLMGYVRLSIDALNLKALVRAHRIGKSPEFVRQVMISGGNADTARLISSVQSGASIEDIFSFTPLEQAAAAGALAMRGESGLMQLEKLCDNALIAYASAARYVCFGEQPVVAYIVAKEQEITAVRTIMSGRLAKMPSYSIRERLREAYV